MPSSPDADADAATDILTDATPTDDSFFTWYHHALAIGYSVSAAVSMSSLPLPRLALYTTASLCGAYVVVAVLTTVWRRAVPRLLSS